MMKIVPKHISSFFLYRKWFNDIKKRQKCLGLIIVGKTGSGKSWLALKIASDLDPSFDAATRIVYTAEEFMHLIAYGGLKRGQAIIFDELAHAEGGDSRAAMSRSNRLLSGIVSTYRQMGLIVIFVLPTLTQLDKNLRMVSIDGYFVIKSIDYVKKLTIAEFRANDLNVVLGKSYYKYPVVFDNTGKLVKVTSFSFAAPPKDLVKVYTKRKKEFVHYIAKKAADENSPMRLVDSEPSVEDYVNRVKLKASEFMVNGKFNVLLIKKKLGITRDDARDVALIAAAKI